MSIVLKEIIRKLDQHSASQMAGAVKTFPLRKLLKSGHLIQDILEHRQKNPFHGRHDLQRAYAKLQEIVAKRMEAAQALAAKFSAASPEVISFNNSIFALVPSHDVLQDAKVAYSRSQEQLAQLAQASANVLEAVNIKIQQRFHALTPEAVALNYSGKDLDSYRKLLKTLLLKIEVDSPVFKVYSTIIRNIIEGSQIYESSISVARSFCWHIFQSDPPDFERVFHRYTLDELELYSNAIQATLRILEQDISARPSIVEFAGQCRQILNALPHHFTSHKIQMRKTIRVLQLSHYISFLSPQSASKNTTNNLILCQMLFEEARDFLLNQQQHLDVALNVKSIEEALQKVLEGLRYRQFAIGQFFQDISAQPLKGLSSSSKKWLEDSMLLLQEMQHVVEEYIQRSPHIPEHHILSLSESIRENVAKLHQAIDRIETSRKKTGKASPGKLNRDLPNLNKFYDEELVRLIHKTLSVNGATENNIKLADLSTSFAIPTDQLREYIESFLRIIQPSTSQ